MNTKEVMIEQEQRTLKPKMGLSKQCSQSHKGWRHFDKEGAKMISALDKELKNSLPSTFFPLFRRTTKLTHVFVTLSFEAFQST